jgi:hypothetical protein
VIVVHPGKLSGARRVLFAGCYAVAGRMIRADWIRNYFPGGMCLVVGVPFPCAGLGLVVCCAVFGGVLLCYCLGGLEDYFLCCVCCVWDLQV